MVETGKVPYQPSQTHRFIISTDQYSQERFAAVQSAVRGVINQYPAFVDAVLLGSLSKGKVLTPESLARTDIDLVFFLDSNRAFEAHPELVSREPQYRDYLDMVKTFDPMASEQAQALGVHAYCALDITERLIRSSLSAENQIDLKTSTINAKPVDLSGRFSILNETKATFWGATDWSHHQTPIVDVPAELAHVVSDVALYWGWDLNGGLKPYRKAFFADLEKLDNNTKHVNWKAVDNYIRYWERKYQIPPQLERFYPATFEEAVRYYVG